VKILQTPSFYNFYILLTPTPYIKKIFGIRPNIHRKNIELSINGFLNVKTELFLVVTDFPYGELVKTMMFDVYH
jgi:hypothetical protein